MEKTFKFKRASIITPGNCFIWCADCFVCVIKTGGKETEEGGKEEEGKIKIRTMFTFLLRNFSAQQINFISN